MEAGIQYLIVNDYTSLLMITKGINHKFNHHDHPHKT